MNGYATGISNGFLSPNDVHRLENMDLIPAEQGGDDYYLNGGYVKLRDAGAFANNGNPAPQKAVSQPEETEDLPEEQPEEEHESENHAKQHEQRKKQRRQ